MCGTENDLVYLLRAATLPAYFFCQNVFYASREQALSYWGITITFAHVMQFGPTPEEKSLLGKNGRAWYAC